LISINFAKAASLISTEIHFPIYSMYFVGGAKKSVSHLVSCLANRFI